jgi:hypothetical protein
MSGGVLLCQGVGQRVDVDDVEDGSEGFGLYDLPVVARADDRRLHEIAGLGNGLTAVQKLATGGLGRRDRRFVGIDGPLIDQRASPGDYRS